MRDRSVWSWVLNVDVRNADRFAYNRRGEVASATIAGETSACAAGVGGLLYVKCNDEIYVPFYDAYGNVMGYWDENGAIVAEYVYDAFGRTVAKNGTMADVFSIRYSTKYYDAETGMYYYGRRFYVTALCRWLTRDPIEEQGGVNLYAQSNNNIVNHFDAKGLFVYNTLSANYPLKSDYPTDVTLTNNIWQLIGGKVLQNAKSGTFKNSCAIRLSHSLNKSGELIPYTAGQTSSGKDPPKWWYIFRVAQMKSHLTQKYGNPAVYTDRTKFEKCAPKGILVLDVPGWSDASGHVTLWDGNATIDEAKDEYFGKPNVIFNLWREKE